MKTALQFSGGKDSLALVYYMQALWNFIDIVFMDTGDTLPETLQRVEEIKAIAPNFIHLRSDSVAYRAIHGNPTAETWAKCCFANIWQPMNTLLVENGYKQVLRGTKRTDAYAQFVFPGEIVNGLLFTFPLWDWTDQEVRNYLGSRLPMGYLRGAQGMPDCKTCPAIEACGVRTKEVWNANV